MPSYMGTNLTYLTFFMTQSYYDDALEPRPGAAMPDLAGKVVFVGNAEHMPALNSDSYNTVFSTADGIDISGVEVAATAFLNLMYGSDLQIPGIAAQAALLMLAG